jgi:hypothetical protein
MKQYKVTLKDKREELVVAEDHRTEDGRVVFIKDGKIIPDIYFKDECVCGVNVADPDYNEHDPAMNVFKG